jgi:flagellar basal body-associated protein FliL
MHTRRSAKSSSNQQGFILLIVFLILLLLAGVAASFIFVKNKQGKSTEVPSLTSFLRRD